jgi:hypothetical protein
MPPACAGAPAGAAWTCDPEPCGATTPPPAAPVPEPAAGDGLAAGSTVEDVGVEAGVAVGLAVGLLAGEAPVLVVGVAVGVCCMTATAPLPSLTAA